MKKYTVQIQFDVKSIDLLDMDVEANSPEEARVKALAKYEDIGDTDNEMYASNYIDVGLRMKSMTQWEVEEKDDDC